MKRSTVTLAAGLLFTAAAVKLLFPVQSRKTIETLVIPTSAPSVLLQTDPVPVAVQDNEPVTMTINAAEYFAGSMAAPAASDLPAAVEEAVETFYGEQEPFADMTMPVNVTYDVSIPDFYYVRPVQAVTSSSFGYRVHPLENLTKFHYGTDLAAQSGDDILSFADGKVTEIGEDENNGRYLRIEHENGYASMYAHCGTIYVHQGQHVAAGEKIALVGSSGKVTGPHLHFELTKDGIYMNPELIFAAL